MYAEQHFCAYLGISLEGPKYPNMYTVLGGSILEVVMIVFSRYNIVGCLDPPCSA